ncbi:MAG: cysteine--tRNA ligase [Candidatus Woesearchaeota archaeon]
MSLHVTNTMTRKKELFVPISGKNVGLYSCGPTVYHDAHIGNLRTFMFNDVLKRSLEYLGFNVKHVMNITDVGHLESDADTGEDKMAKGAKREGLSVWDIAKKYEESMWKDMAALNNRRPDIVCNATKHIKQMQDMIKKIEKNKHTYTADGNVYYDISTFPDYTKLSGAKLEDEKESRVEEDEHKKNKHDFVLWFTRSKFMNQEMQWDSPWGSGFPGWHIECSAMSSHYLGEQFDIHTGGEDLVHIHHTNEIAQAEGAFKKHPWVKYWMHTGFLIDKGGKISKSKGEFLNLNSLIRMGFSPMHYRYFCLTAHYRQQLMLSEEALESSKQSYERLKRTIIELRKQKNSSGEVALFQQQFKEAVEDDINTPKALSVLWDALRSDLGSKEKLALALEFDKVIGFGLKDVKEENVNVPAEVKKLLDERDSARKKKEWKRSDELRDKIKEKGFLVLDTPEGQKVEQV